MIKLEDLRSGMRIRGLVPNEVVTISATELIGDMAIVDYRWNDTSNNETLGREDEHQLEIVKGVWQFDADGKAFRLVSEAYRIDLAHAVDPLLDVHTSLIEPLPHQIFAVYNVMLKRHPLRFLLADEPGAGKTIMAGLLIRALLKRGDVRRCLICVPGSLIEQWKDELWTKFRLGFTVFTNDMISASPSGNPFMDHDHLLVKLDQARGTRKNRTIRDLLKQTRWDLVVSDEAHKMSASYSGADFTPTARYRLGELLRDSTRHYLLMTATPHNGKDEDFELFMRLLDEDRFAGRSSNGVSRANAGDLYRRMIKEDLFTFQGDPLFPPRFAYSVSYDLSPEENKLYEAVTNYIRTEFNRAEKLTKGRTNVGLAMTVLQRRLASSPEAIYHSLRRRREGLEEKLKKGLLDSPSDDETAWEDFEEMTASERDEQEEKLIGAVTARLTVEERKAEITTVQELEQQADKVRCSDSDRKWMELRGIFDLPQMQRDSSEAPPKVVVFTEYVDTLHYLVGKLEALTGHSGKIVTIYGSIPQNKRSGIQQLFRDDPNVQVLVATDSAGEGINLQCAHLMVNYDLPWNPNRLQQRFGRIHRIGQTKPCHLWSLVAVDTREGAVFQRLIEKVRNQNNALDGRIFDVLGEVVPEAALSKLMQEALQYDTDDPDFQSKIDITIDDAIERQKALNQVQNGALAKGEIDINAIRSGMEEANARRLQPYHVSAFFVQAFDHFHGGKIVEREARRFELQKVPEVIRGHAKNLHSYIHSEYQRICFDKSLIEERGKPNAEFVRPGHPLLDATVSLILKCERNVTLKQGGLLVDDFDGGTDVHILLYVEQVFQIEGLEEGERHTVSQEIHFIEIDSSGEARDAGVAPYLNYRPATNEEGQKLTSLRTQGRLESSELEKKGVQFALENLITPRLKKFRAEHSEQIDAYIAEVRYGLKREIDNLERRINNYIRRYGTHEQWARALVQPLQNQHHALVERQKARLDQLARQRRVSAKRPLVSGAALIVPAGLLTGDQDTIQIKDERRKTEFIAMQAIMDAETALGNEVTDVSSQNLGYDFKSLDKNGRLRFIEVKGRRADATTVTLTRNELLTALNCGEQYILALVQIEERKPRAPCYVRGYPFSEPDPSAHSVNFKLKDLMEHSTDPQ